MIDYRIGNILQDESEALVNTVNCVGIMGRGIALQFRDAFPENFKEYAAACERGEVQPGKMLVFETHDLTSPRFIINFPTKRHWRGKSRIEDIESGLRALTEVLRTKLSRRRSTSANADVTNRGNPFGNPRLSGPTSFQCKLLRINGRGERI